MGVKGLWTILSPAARIVKLPSLSGQKLAIDASIWILQLLSSRHRKGQVRSYLSGLYLRLGKLLAFGILPLVVFDGATPHLKAQTCRLRSLYRKRREEQGRQALLELMAAKLLTQEGRAVERQEESPWVSVSSSSEEDQSGVEEERVELEAASGNFHSFSQFQLRKYCSGTQSRACNEAPVPAPRKLDLTRKDPALSPRRLAALIRLGILETNSENPHKEAEVPAPAAFPAEPMKSSPEDSSSSDSASEIEPSVPDFSINETNSVLEHREEIQAYQVKKAEPVIATTPAFSPADSLPLQEQLPAVSLPFHSDPQTGTNPTPAFTLLPSLSEHIHSLETQVRLHPVSDDLSKEEIKCEIQGLLRILGIPWLESPMEAEAQCAALEQQGQVDGVITEDSDALLFGAKQVYRGLLSSSLEVERYSADIILRDLGLTREKLVALAQLLGCDYHPGVSGVGPVLAAELIQAFPDLQQMRTVVERPDTGTEEQKRLVTRRSKAVRRVKEVDNLPDPEVEKAYFSPIIDKSQAQFHWFPPQIPQLQAFLRQKLTWSEERSLAFTQPLQNPAAASVFCTLDCYKLEKKKDPPKSKRMRKALKLG